VLVYLHGFASGPASTKAQFFRAQLADRGVELAIPDLAPDFTHLTISSMLAIVEPLVASEPAVLLGSSLGGYVAALTAARHAERVRGLVLFAPAFGFAGLWEASIGPAAVARWRERKILPVHHYGRGQKELLSVELLDDARRYPDEPDPGCPTLVFAGRHDASVPLAAVEHFARARAGRELVVFDAGHELTDVLEPMWERTAAFLRALGALPA
jgi:pimeloyl-ACP methyl ester carboxylesterase